MVVAALLLTSEWSTSYTGRH